MAKYVAVAMACTSVGLAWASEHAAHGGHDTPSPAKVTAKVTKNPAHAANPEPSQEAPTPPESKPSRLGASVPMSALRELLDQTIAEVRAQQAPAPVVRVSPPKAPPKPRHAATPKPEATQAALANAQHNGGSSSSATTHSEAAHWSYAGEGGPAQWGSMKPDNRMCSVGQRQSPIDIRDGIKVELEPIQFDYRPTQFRVIDNGHTVQVNLEPGNSIVIGGRRYDLVQFHFHRPSEERINSRQFDMVAHLVHKDVQGRLAVVAVLMEQGMVNPMVQLVWNSLPLEKNTEQYAPVMLDMNRMLPEQRHYYTYMGSLTTPPCSEGVLWLVMKQPASMSPEQINIFSRLYPMNARPIQPTGGRLIKEGQ
jgi:carbonic anhydrase